MIIPTGVIRFYILNWDNPEPTVGAPNEIYSEASKMRYFSKEQRTKMIDEWTERFGGKLIYHIEPYIKPSAGFTARGENRKHMEKHVTRKISLVPNNKQPIEECTIKRPAAVYNNLPTYNYK